MLQALARQAIVPAMKPTCIPPRTPLRSVARCVGVFALTVASWANAQVATVRIDPSRAGPAVNRQVLSGFNFGNWMSVTEFRDEMAKVPAAALRFPGGNIGDEHDMDEPTLDAFKSLLSQIAGERELLVQTRVFEGRPDRPAANTPQDAARAVRMARARGLNVRIWEIGNEPDLFSTVRGDPRWTVQRYCEVFRAQAAAIRREDPKALIAGPAVSGAQPGAPLFLERFVELCGDVVDVLTWHIYPTEGDGTEEAALATVVEVDRSTARFSALWKDRSRNPLGHKRSIRFGVTEYGLSWRTDRPRFLSDQVGAMWAAESALRMAQQGVNLAHYFAYMGTGFHGLLDTGGVPRPTYYGFGLLGELDGSFVEAASSDSMLWAHATKKGSQLQLVLFNTRTQPQPVRIDGQAALTFKDARFFDAGIAEEEKPLQPLAAQAGRTITLPARSMAIVRLELAP
jgi:hypothetical protein